MQGIAKAVLITIIVSILFLMFINLAMFFPWYMTLVVNTFNVSQMAASDNYLKDTYYYDTLHKLQDAPIFREKWEDIEIIVETSDGRPARGVNNETYYIDEPDYAKPYRQRGETITVTISAVYPLFVTLWGTRYEREITVSFSMKTTGLKHYKDLDYNLG